MSDVGDLLKGIAAAMWVLLALLIFLAFRRALTDRAPFLTKLGLSPAGVSMEFAQKKLAEAASTSDEETRQSVGHVGTTTVIRRLERNSDLLSRARVLWVDDHPENNVALVELLRKYGARVETPRSNEEAYALLRANAYDVVISDVGRDNEGAESGLRGIELAETVFAKWGQQTVIFTARFDPTNLPDVSDAERLALARTVREVVFGRTYRYDEVLHLILDVLERRSL